MKTDIDASLAPCCWAYARLAPPLLLLLLRTLSAGISLPVFQSMSRSSKLGHWSQQYRLPVIVYSCVDC